MLPSASTVAEPATVKAVAAEVPLVGRGQRAALVVAAIELAVLCAPTVVWLFDRWTMSVWHNAHGLLIPPIVCYFALQELKPLRRLPAASSAWGFAFVVPALVLLAVDAGMHTQLLSAVAMLIAAPGLSLLVLGVQRTRAIIFPLAFLAFALPIPLALTEQIHWQLRQVATAGTAAVVPWLGVPVFVEGTTLHLARGVLEVADACSGFSTLYASAAVACLTAYTAATATRRAIVLLSFVPLAIAANLARVILLVLLASWYGTSILDTWLHPASGLMTFALALPIIFWLGGPQAEKATP